MAGGAAEVLPLVPLISPIPSILLFSRFRGDGSHFDSVDLIFQNENVILVQYCIIYSLIVEIGFCGTAE